jgi:hypothetical protein
MSTHQAIRCPICGQGHEIDVGTFDGHAIRCPTHDEFELTDSALREKSREPADWTEALSLVKRRMVPGKRPRIFTYDF